VSGRMFCSHSDSQKLTRSVVLVCVSLSKRRSTNSSPISMAVICCASRRPYRPTCTDEENKFSTFLKWADGMGTFGLSGGDDYVIQAVKQINFGPVEQVTYFHRTSNGYEQVDEDFVIRADMHKTNLDFKCDKHNKFFEINLYGRSTFSKHHWKANVARDRHWAPLIRTVTSHAKTKLQRELIQADESPLMRLAL